MLDPPPLPFPPGRRSSIVLSLDRTGSAFVERLQMWKVGGAVMWSNDSL